MVQFLQANWWLVLLVSVVFGAYALSHLFNPQTNEVSLRGWVLGDVVVCSLAMVNFLLALFVNPELRALLYGIRLIILPILGVLMVGCLIAISMIRPVHVLDVDEIAVKRICIFDGLVFSIAIHAAGSFLILMLPII